MNESINYDLQMQENLAIFKLKESKFDAQISGLVKGEFTILLHSDEVKNLILDMSEVEYCDSSGLSSILLAFRILQSSGGAIRIAAPSSGVKSLIEISQLSRILPITETVEQAIEELK